MLLSSDRRVRRQSRRARQSSLRGWQHCQHPAWRNPPTNFGPVTQSAGKWWLSLALVFWLQRNCLRCLRDSISLSVSCCRVCMHENQCLQRSCRPPGSRPTQVVAHCAQSCEESPNQLEAQEQAGTLGCTACSWRGAQAHPNVPRTRTELGPQGGFLAPGQAPAEAVPIVFSPCSPRESCCADGSAFLR